MSQPHYITLTLTWDDVQRVIGALSRVGLALREQAAQRQETA